MRLFSDCAQMAVRSQAPDRRLAKMRLQPTVIGRASARLAH